MNKQIALILALTMTGSGVAMAGHHEHSKTADMEIGVDTGMSVDKQFKKLDTDGNGVISEAEAKANKHAKHAFQSFDDGDGKLTKAEFAKGLKARASGKGNVNAGASAEDGSLEGENATIGAGTDTEIRAGAELGENSPATNKAKRNVAAGIGAAGEASDNEEAAKNLEGTLQKRFRALDNNDNGVISRSEAKADPVVIGAFDTHDKDNNGNLDESEFVAAAKAGVKTQASP